MRRAFLGMVGAALALGCSTVPPRVGEPPAHVADAAQEAAYKDLFDRWTRRAEVDDALDTRMYLAATLQSPEFVRGRAERMAVFQSLPRADADALVARELGDLAGGYSAFLGLQTNDRRVNDLDRASSVWRVSLHSSVGEVTASSIERVSRPDANLRGIYEYLGDFWIGYRVRFPASLADGRPLVPAGDAQLTLQLDSAVGHAKLEFPAISAALAAPVAVPAAKAP